MTIKCITFDLDDTLWECTPVMVRAEERFYAWLNANYPGISARYSLQGLLEDRRTYFSRFPDLHHDLTRLRKQWIGRLAEEASYGEELVDLAFEVFWRARNEVELYEEAADALEKLGRLYRVGAITNGNADVHYIGIGHYFDFVVTAASTGAAKPHPEIFLTALDEAGVLAHEAVHVGDDPERDIMGARAVGMRTIWVNPRMQPWPHDGGPDATITSLEELPKLLASWHSPSTDSSE